MTLLCSSVPLRHNSVTVRQHAQYQDRQTEATDYGTEPLLFIFSLTPELLWLFLHFKISSVNDNMNETH